MQQASQRLTRPSAGSSRDTIRTSATEENESTVALIIGLADRLQRALGLLEESGNRRLGHFRSARDARLQAQALRALVLATVPAAAADLTRPEAVLAESDKFSRACRMLPLLLELDQPPVLAGSCVVDSAQCDPRFPPKRIPLRSGR